MAINIDKLEKAIRLIQQVPGLEMRKILSSEQRQLLEQRLVDEIGEIVTPKVREAEKPKVTHTPKEPEESEKPEKPKKKK